MWNEFVDDSKNGTFLFRREYMDYHADRFPDASLVVEDAGGRARALFPATADGDAVLSHAGLTYGGFVLDESATTPIVGEIFEVTLRYLASAGHSRLLYKTVPHIYHRLPAEEDRYWLFRHGASLVRRDVLSVMGPAERPAMQKRRERSLRRGADAHVAVDWTDDYPSFWALLTSSLRDRYGVDPVHSLDEIELLASRFQEIKLAAAYLNGELLAGAVVYQSHRVCHVQYNATSGAGRKHSALDQVMAWLIEHGTPSAGLFDFGISTEQAGTFLNAGLVDYKEGFGGRAIVHDVYEIELSAFARGD
jgi:hypothetical protein